MGLLLKLKKCSARMELQVSVNKLYGTNMYYRGHLILGAHVLNESHGIVFSVHLYIPRKYQYFEHLIHTKFSSIQKFISKQRPV